MKEKRGAPRFELELPVTLRTEGKLIPAACLDISNSGICVLTEYSSLLSEGPVEVIIDLSSDLKDISIKGEILRLDRGIERKVAIQFEKNPTSKGQKQLHQFLSLIA